LTTWNAVRNRVDGGAMTSQRATRRASASATVFDAVLFFCYSYEQR
jgi:hypothetical protein